MKQKAKNPSIVPNQCENCTQGPKEQCAEYIPYKRKFHGKHCAAQEEAVTIIMPTV